jgi:hypothetical protein
MTPVWVLAPDLMDRSKIAAAAPAARFVADADELRSAPIGATVVVDLGRAGAVDAVRGLAGRRRIGFGSHVDREVLAAARGAGYDVVVARREFFRRLADLLAGEVGEVSVDVSGVGGEPLDPPADPPAAGQQG